MVKPAVNKTITKSTSTRKFVIPKLTDLKKMPIGDILKLSQDINACQKAIESLVGGIKIPQYQSYQQPAQPSLIPTSSAVALPIKKSDAFDLKIDQNYHRIEVEDTGSGNWLDDGDTFLPFSGLGDLTGQLAPAAEISELIPEE